MIDKGADLDEVVTKARTVLQTRSGLIAEAFDRQGGRTIDVTGWSKAAAEVGQAADVLTAVSHLLPLVLVIDDAHDLDPISLQLLATLRQRRLVGLIVLTACTRSPDGEVVEGEFARWVSELAGQGRVERHRLARLDPASMAKIAANEMPEVFDPRASLAVVTEYADGNPLALRELLQLPAVQDAVRTGRDLAGLLPRLHPEGDLSHLYEAAWTALPVQARRVLALAGVFGQTTCEPRLLETAAPVLSPDHPALTHQARQLRGPGPADHAPLRDARHDSSRDPGLPPPQARRPQRPTVQRRSRRGLAFAANKTMVDESAARAAVTEVAAE